MGNYPANIKYTQTDNRIDIINFSLVTPGNFLDLYDTDVASKPTSADRGTNTDRLGLLLESGNGQGDTLLVNDQAMRLVESCGQLVWVFVQSATHAGKTVDFHGTDINGNLDENAVAFQACTGALAGVWIYATSTKLFRSMVSVDLNAMGGAVNYEVYQERWGVIRRLSHLIPGVNLGYSIDAFIYVGAAGVHGYFGDTSVSILVERHKTYVTYVDFMEAMDDYGHITFGIPDLINKRGYSGVDFTAYIRHTSKRGKKPFIKGKDVNCYGCDFQGLMTRANYYRTYTLDYCDGNLYDNTFYQWYYPIAHAGDNVDINGLNAANSLSLFDTCSALMTLNDIKVYSQNFGLYCGGMVVRNMVMSGITGNEIYLRYPGDLYMIDCILLSWNVMFYNASGFDFRIYRQYSFNFKVVDENGDPVIGAKIYLVDKDNNQALSDPEPGEAYALTVAGTGAIPEQVVSYGYYTRITGDVLQSYSPHTLTIKHYDHTTYTAVMDLNATIDYVLTLSDDPWVTKSSGEAAVIDGGCN